MAVPPSTPTAFVPRQASVVKRRLDLGGAFAFVCYGVLILSFVAAGGVYLYGNILTAQLNAKNQQLADAQAHIDQPTVTALLALQNRLAAGKRLLDDHLTLAPIFDLVEQFTLANVRLSSLTINVTNGVVSLGLAGTARNFNALAAESAAVAKEPRIKDAIFAGIQPAKDGTVSFSVTGLVDATLVVFSAGAAGAAPAESPSATTTLPVASTTPQP